MLPPIFALLLWQVAASPSPLPDYIEPPGDICPGGRLVWWERSHGVYYFRNDPHLGEGNDGEWTCQQIAEDRGAKPSWSRPR